MGSSVQNLIFVNMAMPLNMKDDEFDNFPTNSAPIKDLPIKSFLKWSTWTF